MKVIDQEVHSPTKTFKLPSVVALKNFVMPQRRPAFTRFNVFLRDNFTCQYCYHKFSANELTFDHLIPRCLNGKTTWNNVVSACTSCNLKKGRRLLKYSRHKTKKNAFTTYLNSAPKIMEEIFLLIFYMKVGVTICTGTQNYRTRFFLKQ